MEIIAEHGTAEDRRRWQRSYLEDVDAIATTLAAEGIAVRGRRVAVIDSGDGITALGLATRLGAARVDAFDDAGCNTVTLATWAGWYAQLAELPDVLAFHQTRPYELPGAAGGYDLAVWWGGLGGRRDPVRMLGEIARLLAPQGQALIEVPSSGQVTAEDLHRAVLAARLMLARLDVDAATIRPSLEERADDLSRLVTRGARMLAFRPA